MSVMHCQEPPASLGNMVVEPNHRATVPYPALCSASPANTQQPQQPPYKVYGDDHRSSQEDRHLGIYPDNISRIPWPQVHAPLAGLSVRTQTQLKEKAARDVFFFAQSLLFWPKEVWCPRPRSHSLTCLRWRVIQDDSCIHDHLSSCGRFIFKPKVHNNEVGGLYVRPSEGIGLTVQFAFACMSGWTFQGMVQTGRLALLCGTQHWWQRSCARVTRACSVQEIYYNTKQWEKMG